VLTLENLRKTLEAAGCAMGDLVSATRYLTDVAEQDDLNRVWVQYLGGHLPTTTTVEVSRLATHPRCKVEISAIAVTGGD
jgi:2-iminobutanoate/2-iminopropanoate deaminase